MKLLVIFVKITYEWDICCVVIKNSIKRNSEIIINFSGMSCSTQKQAVYSLGFYQDSEGGWIPKDAQG